jgi:P-type E1-E2 ATPase
VINLEIPGVASLQLSALVLDMNGTLTLDGKLMEGVEERIHRISERLEIHMITADTFGAGKEVAARLNIPIHRLSSEDPEAIQKAKLVRRLQADRVVAIGNGANDIAMLREAAVGIAVIGPEGCSREALEAADIVAPSIVSALDLLLNPMRLVATLRR